MKSKKYNVSAVVFYSVIIALALILPNMAFAAPVPDTGQTKCYDNSQEIPCPQLGQQFYGQDAQYTANQISYTKLDLNGNELPDLAANWAMIRDNVTGLIWENKTDDDSIHNNNTYTWQNAQDVLIENMNEINFGGLHEWRLPTFQELAFIVNSDRIAPTINTTYFANTMLFDYWTSTNYLTATSTIWCVNFNIGIMSLGNIYNNYSARAVHGRQSFSSYIDNGNGTVD